MHILVVDDEPLAAHALQAMLHKMGHTAPPPLASADAALRAVAEARPEIVLIAAGLAGQPDGPATARLLREAYGVPTMLLVPRAAAAQPPAEPFSALATPVDEHELRVALEVVTYKHAMEQRLRASDARLATTLRSIADAVIATDTAARVTFVNPAAARLAGVAPEAAVGMALADLLPLEGAHDDVVAYALAAGEPLARERPALLRAPDGVERRIAYSVAPVVAESGAITGAVIVLRDVTAQQRAEADQRRHTMEVTALSELGGHLLRCASVEEACAVIARAARRLFPGDDGALIIQRAGHDTFEAAVVWGSYPTDRAQLTPESCWALRTGRLATPEQPPSSCACAARGDAAPSSICVPLLVEGESLGVIHIRLRPPGPEGDRAGEGGRRDQIALALAEHAALGLANIRLRETLREEAIRDPLTGLYNRRYLEATLIRELHRAARNRYPIGIIIVDIDHFKRINDTFGHDAGDIVLRALGICLIGAVRAEDVVCRYGGEEFVLMMPSATEAIALARAEQICASVRALRVSHEGLDLGAITVSVGVSTLPDHEATVSAALARADAALYRAKRSGRDRVVLAPSR